MLSVSSVACGGADYGDESSTEIGTAGQAGQSGASGQSGSFGGSTGGSAGTTGSNQGTCEPGLYIKTSCCPGNTEGRQRCNDQGTYWGDCECSGAGGSSGQGGSVGTGGSSGKGGSTNVGGSAGVSGTSQGGAAGSSSGGSSGTAGSGGSTEVTCDGQAVGTIVDAACCAGGSMGKLACLNTGTATCYDCASSGQGGSSGVGGSAGVGGASSQGGAAGSSTGGSSGTGGSSQVVTCGSFPVGKEIDTFCCLGGKPGKQVCLNTGIFSACYGCTLSGTGGSSGQGGSSGVGGNAGTGGSASHDWDNDGSFTPDDCDDNNSSIRPGISEKCDGVDQDCDDQIDEGCPVDKDHDGFSPPDDCNDTNALINYAAVELCNGVDDNCNGLIDEGCTVPTTDSDNDGDPAATDCNDSVASIHHGANEVCANNVDDDCDGQIDEGCTVTNTDPILTCHFASPKPGTHDYYAFAGDLGTDSQDPMVWGADGQPFVTLDQVWGKFSHQVRKGNLVVLNVVADPPSPNPSTDWSSGDSTLRNKFWSGTVACSSAPLAQAMNVWCEISENGVTRPTSRPYAQSNGEGGCNLMVMAAPSTTYGPTDSDGDGFANANDCGANDPSMYPGAVELQFDNTDQDCDGLYNSPRLSIKMCVQATLAYTPMMRNVSHWGQDASMPYVGNGCYETGLLWAEVAPHEFWIEWGTSGNMSYDNSYWGGVCHENATGVTMKIESGSVISVALQKVSGKDECHRFTSGF